MTIDERLEKLTERHESLTQAVELMVAENRDRDEKWDARMTKLVGTVDRLVGTVEMMATLAASHERRITNLEGGTPS
jgi:hypothetical protein